MGPRAPGGRAYLKGEVMCLFKWVSDVPIWRCGWCAYLTGGCGGAEPPPQNLQSWIFNMFGWRFFAIFNFQFSVHAFNFSIFQFAFEPFFNFHFSTFQFPPYCVGFSIFNFGFQFSKLRSLNLSPLLSLPPSWLMLNPPSSPNPPMIWSFIRSSTLIFYSRNHSFAQTPDRSSIFYFWYFWPTCSMQNLILYGRSAKSQIMELSKRWQQDDATRFR